MSNRAATDPTLSCACDNKSALRYSFDLRFSTVGADTPDFDVLQNTRLLQQLAGIQPRWRHVKGHQVGGDLDIWARLNNVADKLAGIAREDDQLNQPPPNVLLGREKWQIQTEGVKITKDTSTLLFEYCTTTPVKEVLHKYGRVSRDGFDLVDWQAMENAMHGSTIRQRHWISKRAARDCGCNHIRFKRK
jgi:hypothetical protein